MFCVADMFLFDLFAIATGLEYWHRLILNMYDVSVSYWNLLWGSFIVIGAFSFILGLKLMIENKR